MQTVLREYLTRLKSSFPTFRRFGDGDEALSASERAYKLELVDLFRKQIDPDLRNFPPEQATKIGTEVIALFTRKLSDGSPQNLVGYRYWTPLTKLDEEGRAIFARLTQSLLYGTDMLPQRIDGFVTRLRALLSDSSVGSAWAPMSRSVTSFLLMLMNPAEHVIIKTREFNRALKAFGSDGLDMPLTGEEYIRIQSFLKSLFVAMTEEGLSPRDLIDVQTLIWVGDPKGYMDNKELLSHFNWRDDFKNAYENTLPEDRDIFFRMVQMIHDLGLDWYFTGESAQLRCARKELDGGDGEYPVVIFNLNAAGLTGRLYSRFAHALEKKERTVLLAELDTLCTEAEIQAYIADKGISKRISGESYWPDDYDSFAEAVCAEKIKTEDREMPLNTILFGPPGTGKTFATIDETLRILDPDFFRNNNGERAVLNEKERAVLKMRFDELVTEERVRFVTFHQSFSYEDFVEGLRAITNDDKQIEYLVEPGVFKRLCDDARTSGVQQELGIRSNPRIWKISINGTGASPTKTYCLNHGEARIGWGETGDLGEGFKPNEYYQSLGTGDQGTLRYFAEEMGAGDILLCIHSSEMIAAVGVVTGDYRYENTPPQQVVGDYNHVRPVNWLYRDLQLSVLPLNDGKQFTLKTVYSMDRFSWGDLLEYIEQSGGKSTIPAMLTDKPRPYVLIVDEINRGNISRIFGELITLIEPSKRAGANEALNVTLPYSKKPFSVPSNVYLIGTMNTADRSLAGLDIALRRRFTFREMPPRPEFLDAVTIEGINIGQILRVMNERIQILLGGDHCLGHAYFMGLKNNSPFADLKFIFRQQILPLLQEYFFEDWERIAWVLNDQNKQNGRFIEKIDSDMNALFGPQVPVSLQTPERRWRINEKAFDQIESYRAILGVPA